MYIHVKISYELQITFCHLNNEMIWESQTLMPRPNIKQKVTHQRHDQNTNKRNNGL